MGLPIDREAADVMRGAAQGAVLHVASVADSLLDHMGGPPARDGN